MYLQSECFLLFIQTGTRISDNQHIRVWGYCHEYIQQKAASDRWYMGFTWNIYYRRRMTTLPIRPQSNTDKILPIIGLNLSKFHYQENSQTFSKGSEHIFSSGPGHRRPSACRKYQMEPLRIHMGHQSKMAPRKKIFPSLPDIL